MQITTNISIFDTIIGFLNYETNTNSEFLFDEFYVTGSINLCRLGPSMKEIVKGP